MNKKYIGVCVASLLAIVGCSSTVPSSAGDVEVTTQHDKFKSQTWVETPFYVIRTGFTDRFPVRVKYRLMKSKNSVKFIQLYVVATRMDWGFYNQAVSEDGVNIRFTEISRSVDKTTNIVMVKEHFALNLSTSDLEKMSRKDWEIKIYGKNDEGVFIVPAHLTKGFLDAIEK